MTTENKYTWNDPVKIKDNSPTIFFPGEVGVVCGMGKIQNQELADKYFSQIDSWMYTVEFEDGSDATIPEEYLEKYEENTQNNS